MKMPRQMWIQLLLSVNKKEYGLDCFVRELISVNSIVEFDHENSVELAACIIAKQLGVIDLENNPKIKEEFFKNYKDVSFEEKNRVFTKTIKTYFAKNMLNNPDLDCLYLFRKELSKQELQKGLNVFFAKTKFIKEKSYWDDILCLKQIKNLLFLLNFAEMSNADLIKFNKIGFARKNDQLKFDKLLGNNVL